VSSREKAEKRLNRKEKAYEIERLMRNKRSEDYRKGGSNLLGKRHARKRISHQNISYQLSGIQEGHDPLHRG